MQILSMKAYAELRGCSAMAVSLAVKDKRLVKSVIRNATGRPYGINVEIANKEWDANTNHSKIPLNQPTKKVKKPKPVEPTFTEVLEKQVKPTIRGAKPTPQAEPSEPEAFRPPNVGTESENFAASRAKREAYAAEIARLDFEERQGTLVDAEKVRGAAYKVARRIRDGLLNIPDRVAGELAGLTDSFLVHQRLTEEVRQVLTELAKEEGVSSGQV
jgi:hypothetical protein